MNSGDESDTPICMCRQHPKRIIYEDEDDTSSSDSGALPLKRNRSEEEEKEEEVVETFGAWWINEQWKKDYSSGSSASSNAL
ncbi:hypothetical protein BGX33_000458 [Mortierella sp. NVP41]|nr:hypothetical protein BGX33_000458 [Mortierella sp. NVP41]